MEGNIEYKDDLILEYQLENQLKHWISASVKMSHTKEEVLLKHTWPQYFVLNE